MKEKDTVRICRICGSAEGKEQDRVKVRLSILEDQRVKTISMGFTKDLASK